MLPRLPTAIALLLVVACMLACKSLLDDRSDVGLCGDGTLQSDMREQCDDGNTVAGDGCSSTCIEERCGNGVKDPDEGCDEGDRNDNDGNCTLQCTQASCGDGHVHSRGTPPFERCDDGNRDNGDGCDPYCALRGRVSVIAGELGGMGMADGVGPAARFAGVRGLAIAENRLYLSDKESCTIRELNIDTGQVTTIAGIPGNCPYVNLSNQPTFVRGPKHLAVVGQHLYLGDGNELRRIELSTGKFAVTTCLQVAKAATGITGLASDPLDRTALYVATALGVYSLSLPCGCDPDLHSGEPSCPMVPLAGGEFGHLDGEGQAARFMFAEGITLDPQNRILYVGDLTWIRAVDIASRQVTTVAGSAPEPGVPNRLIQNLVFSNDSLYVAEVTTDMASVTEPMAGRWGWGTVRRFDTKTRQESLVAGIYGSLLSGSTPEADGFGPFARLVYPWSLAIRDDVLFVGEDTTIRSVALSTGQVVTASGVLVQDFTYYGVRALAARSGNLYVLNNAGELLEIPVATSGPARRLSLCPVSTVGMAHMATGMVIDESDLFISDLGIGGICRVNLDGQGGEPCCAGCQETCDVVWSMNRTEFILSDPSGLGYDGQFFYVGRSSDGQLLQLDPRTNGHRTIPLDYALSSNMSMIAIGSALYVTLPDDNRVVRLDLTDDSVYAYHVTGSAQTVDGRTDVAGGTDVAAFCHPSSIATDGTSLFIGESHCPPGAGAFNGHAIRQLNIETGQVTTLVGPGPQPWVVEGAGSKASVNRPAAIAYDSATAAIYVADAWDNVLLRID